MEGRAVRRSRRGASAQKYKEDNFKPDKSVPHATFDNLRYSWARTLDSLVNNFCLSFLPCYVKPNSIFFVSNRHSPCHTPPLSLLQVGTARASIFNLSETVMCPWSDLKKIKTQKFCHCAKMTACVITSLHLSVPPASPHCFLAPQSPNIKQVSNEPACVSRSLHLSTKFCYFCFLRRSFSLSSPLLPAKLPGHVSKKCFRNRCFFLVSYF